MSTPNYGALLQSFWTPATQPIPENSSLSQTTEPADIAEFLGDDLLWQTTTKAQEPTLRDIPGDLPPELTNALHEQGINRLYSHQLKALQAIRAGKSLILTSPTASGKTLSIYPGMIEGCMQGHRALVFYGFKALAADQYNKVSSLLAKIPQKVRPRLGMITGDVKEQDKRAEILASNPHILAVTPELIHFQLRQAWKSEGWAGFYSKLRYIAFDEAHTLSGSYGANMAWLIRRIKLAVDRYGGDSKQLQFIFLSATCGNPRQLAQKLSALKPTKRDLKPIIWIRKSGAAVPPKRIVVTHPSHNLTADTARIIQFLLSQGKSGIAFCNSRRSVRELTGLLKSAKVSAFYSGITPERRAEVVEQLQAGTIQWIVATDALEAGIDLPELECCVLRGWPGSKKSYQQRAGRAGRQAPGLTVLILNALNPIDLYVAEHPEMLVSGEAEEVSFNDEYPIFAAKHLMCAAAETGIPTDKIKHYFGSAAVEVAKLLLSQGHLNKGRNGLWTKGNPHIDINFRGGATQSTIKLVDAESGEELEEVSLDIAYREVHPRAIYKRQDIDGKMLAYNCISLDLQGRRAILKQAADNSLYTVANTEFETSSIKLLTDPVQVPLLLPQELHECDREQKKEFTPAMKLELSFGQVSYITSGYSLMNQIYEQTCLNKRCLSYKEPLPGKRQCPSCGKATRKAIITETLAEENFEQPYRVQFSTPMVKVILNQQAQAAIEQVAKATRLSLSRTGLPIPPGYQQLWEHPSNLIALHSFGHQIMQALQLVVRADPKEVNFATSKELGETSIYVGYFYDEADGGNGASEAVFKQLPELARAAAAIARSCDCSTGCAKCLIQHGCPDGNTALLKQLGLVLLEAIAPPSPN
ncbi:MULTISPECIES: DEAD/DEAH box helicase [Cyanophyceae]|uniref:DEAD/DEAH box helicase n=1 Tax=Cyanophyceae TaxID=3028117 RepID=UPI0002A6666C|nr:MULTISPECIES: DEAD/DEAH box helicase [Cyanophyceae]AFZ33527.1 DEAD/DEAH box helicase domain protein [Gloeocapsa sp. PCC 7428]PPS42034.1 DEAD/DEAH box helicase [Chroococcidiopsis sp. TS-821]